MSQFLEIKAVNFRPEEPYTFTSGWKSPVYIDCRRIIYFPRARAKRFTVRSPLTTAITTSPTCGVSERSMTKRSPSKMPKSFMLSPRTRWREVRLGSSMR